MTPSLTLPTNYRLFCKFTQESRMGKMGPSCLPAGTASNQDILLQRFNEIQFFSAFKTSYSLMGMGRMGGNSQVKNGKIAGTRRCCSSFITDASEIQTKCSHSTNFCYSSHRCIQGNKSFFLSQRWSWFFQWGNRLFLQAFRLLKRWRQRSAKYITAVMSFVTVLTMPKFIP